MTEEQKRQIEAMRQESVGYKKIAQTLGISLNSVKSYCRHHHLQGKDLLQMSGLCLYCKKPLEIIPHKKPKKYCSDACRMAWWSEHRHMMNHTVVYHHRCLQCGIEFDNGVKKSSFCSRRCYAAFRRKEPDRYVTEENQYSENSGGQSSKHTEEKADSERHEPKADRSGAELSHLPAHCQCASCPWFYNGERHCPDDSFSAQTLSSAHRQSELSETGEVKNAEYCKT